MPRRKQKIYSRPRKRYDTKRIEDENSLVKKYGLKSKREIWKAEAKVGKIRDLAKASITKPEKQQEIFQKLNNEGIKVQSVADVLALNKEDILKRRLQTVIVRKNIARTPRQARQLIVHKHVLIDGKAINIPSYIVNIDEEDKISLR